ncbi:Lytic transglycosylase domain-containing protein [Rhodovastum atsumiense]|uniref:Lytic transglycosylase domain-containing protein n=1 Tax=Rhodovastum atsumiense TaxID=504468 RepID=A0A5M6IWT5_9PROT|nr:lytic transglycosylase domain-containing protein [Rhodovastum atsumiense]KAA5612307.1 lytic transglycosylase domain-containing protein [Rhodovastum atsumiense]CAH2601636.1 Lytic transglycosylase domain-containing protein [Rhodovastum atsumiense]
MSRPGFAQRPGLVARPTPQAALPPWLQCDAAIRDTERMAGIPEHLMAAIGRVESGRTAPDGQTRPWPWSFNAEGADYVFQTKAEAIAAVKALQAKGMRSIDVGCMQVNLMYHPTAFTSLEQAFDPAENTRYAARFLTQLKSQTGTWEKATAYYHSATPERGEPYQRRVMAIWPDAKKRAEETEQARLEATRSKLAAAWAATQRPATPASAGTGTGTGGGFMLSNRSDSARILPMPGGGAGRSLDTYRAMPIPVAARSAGRTAM